MSWYYNQITGTVYHQTGLLKWYTDREISAESQLPDATRTHWGPYDTQAQAQAAAKAHPPRNPLQRAQDVITKPVTDVTSAIASGVNQLGQYMIRFLEAAAGIVLLAIALNAIIKSSTGVDVRQSAGKAAGTVATVAAL